MNKKKKQTTPSELQICEGLSIQQSFFEKKENRLYTLWMKGFIVYLIVFGSMGSYLSAVGTKFSALAVGVVLFLVSLFCCSLYYRKATENLGYLTLLLLMISSGLGLKTYINSGFYAVINDSMTKSSEYFNLTGVKTYGEQIANRYLAITVSMIFLGGTLCILLNVIISRRMQYVLVGFLVLPLLGIPLYMEAEPNLVYVLMLLCGLTILFLYRGSRHYQLTEDNQIFRVEGELHPTISYVYRWKNLSGIFMAATGMVLIVTMLVSVFLPRDIFTIQHGTNTFKNRTKEQAKNLVTLGLAGLFNYYPNAGGLSTGRLGGVSTINLDYNADLKVRFTPYTYERIYLKTLTGGVYRPYNNAWTVTNEEIERVPDQTKEVALLEAAYAKLPEKAAKGKMEVENIAAPIAVYSPYYTIDDDNNPTEPKEITTYTYYPSFGQSTLTVAKDLEESKQLELSKEEQETYTEIPKENMKSIDAFCKEANISGGRQEVIQKVITYFQDHMPYTLSPGATPYNTDFVNYFLEKGKKGYCVHYASAATLVLRKMGIPARYAEGYAIDYEQVIDGNLVQGAKYQDYYSGYSALGETGLIEVEARDADAHAWVEIFTPGFGWQPLEVTPSSSEEAPREGFWSVFMNLFGSAGTSTTTENAPADLTNVKDTGEELLRNTGQIVVGIFTLLGLAVCSFFITKRLVFVYHYQKANRNDKIILAYARYCKKLGKREPHFKEQYNYQQQIEYLTVEKLWSLPSEEEEKQAIRILEQAGFSKQEISQGEFQWLLKYIK